MLAGTLIAKGRIYKKFFSENQEGCFAAGEFFVAEGRYGRQ